MERRPKGIGDALEMCISPLCERDADEGCNCAQCDKELHAQWHAQLHTAEALDRQSEVCVGVVRAV
eukprot:4000966-Alexandrium_andersonii.AAC.1